MERKTLIEQQAKLVDKLQQKHLDVLGDDPELSRALTQAIDKYATLCNPVFWGSEA